MAKEISNHAEKGERFAFETTLAGRGYLKMIKKWRAEGYIIKLILLSLATSEEAINRVKFRVAHGGHKIDDDPDMQGVMPVLYRAVNDAHQIAYQTGTKLVVMRNGKLMEVPPGPAKYKH